MCICIHSYICQTWHIIVSSLIVINDLRENLVGEWEQEWKKIDSLTLPCYVLSPVVFFSFLLCVLLTCRISRIIFLKTNWKNCYINNCFSLINPSLLELNTKNIFGSFFPIALIWWFFKNIQQTSALNQGNNEAICDITLGNHAS